MDHLAILSKEKKLLQKILSKEKTIESRWYLHKRQPYGCIKENDTVYFKETAEPVTATAKVVKVETYDDLTPQTINQILKTKGKQIGVGMDYSEKVKGKRYCILIHLKDARPVAPFEIDKSGHGMMSAWITVKSINELKR